MDDDDLPKSSSMNDSTKTTLAVLIALIVVLMVAGIGVATVRDATETLREVTATTAPPAPGTPEQPPTSSDLSPEQVRVVDEVKAQVAAIRGLEWRGDLPIRFLSKEELSQRVRELNAEEIAENREEISADEAVLKLLKLIPEDLDYAEIFDDILAGAVLGFYDDETKELFVGDSGSAPLDAATRSTLAHELTHALTDQHFDFAARNKALDDEDRTEELAALSALLEGDANLVESIWRERHLTDRERVLAAIGGSSDPSALARAPRYLLESLYFPYQDGLAFVRSRHRAGGFAEVDNAYRDPPTSTEHILHPETYTSGQRWTPPPLPDVAAATGCGRVDTGTLGEFDMAQLLSEEISESDAREAAAGWDGDAYGTVRCGAALGFVDRWQAENPGEAGELADALLRWGRGWSGSSRGTDAEGRFSGPSGSGRVVRNGARVDLVLADDVATADRLARAVAG